MADDMRRVDEVIRTRLSSRVVLIDQIASYIVSAGGKRIRPRLVLLFSQALGYERAERYELAAIVEFIHTATLLHDDVVDESSLRRGRATANAVFGNAASVLVGDFLYSRAFQMMVSIDRMRVLQVLADATNVIAEGEVLQLMNMHDPDLAVDEYLRVIRFKTAKLFEASARLGAVLADAGTEMEERCADYGRSLGTAFQLVDDLLDYEGEQQCPGQEHRRRPARRQTDAAAADRHVARQRGGMRAAAARHRDTAKCSAWRTSSTSCGDSGALDATRDAARARGRRRHAPAPPIYPPRRRGKL